MPPGSRMALGCLTLPGALILLPSTMAAIAANKSPLGLILSLSCVGLFLSAVTIACFFPRIRAQTLHVTTALICFVCITGIIIEVGLALDGSRKMELKSIVVLFLIGISAAWVAVSGRIPRWFWHTEVLADAFGVEKKEDQNNVMEHQDE